jgi:hypothetical protein
MHFQVAKYSVHPTVEYLGVVENADGSVMTFDSEEAAKECAVQHTLDACGWNETYEAGPHFGEPNPFEEAMKGVRFPNE